MRLDNIPALRWLEAWQPQGYTKSFIDRMTKCFGPKEAEDTWEVLVQNRHDRGMDMYQACVVCIIHLEILLRKRHFPVPSLYRVVELIPPLNFFHSYTPERLMLAGTESEGGSGS